MPIMKLSPDQQAAIDKMVAWWEDIPSTGINRLIIHDNQYSEDKIINPKYFTEEAWGSADYKKQHEHPAFIMTGAAGTGKSTVVENVLATLGIKSDEALMVATAATAVKNIQSKNPNAMACTIASLIKERVQFVEFTNKKHTFLLRRSHNSDDACPSMIEDILDSYLSQKLTQLHQQYDIESDKQTPSENTLKQLSLEIERINRCDRINDVIFNLLSDEELNQIVNRIGYSSIRMTRFDTAEEPGRRYKTSWEAQHNQIRGMAFQSDNRGMLLEWEATHPYHKIPKIIIVDELGMVSQSDYEIICRIGIPVLALGDPYQLPAIGNKDNRNRSIYHPDAHLTTIHRQSPDAMLLEVANAAKDKQDYLKVALTADKNGASDVYYKPSQHLPIGAYLGADIILSPTNNSVMHYNDMCHRGYINQHPEVIQKQQSKFAKGTALLVGEPIIITANTHQKTDNGIAVLANGQSGIITAVHMIDQSTYYLAQIDIEVDGEIIENVYVDITDLKNPRINAESLRRSSNGVRLISKRERAGFWHRHPSDISEVVYISYGYAMTIHKSQGKEWNNVMLDSYIPGPMQKDAAQLVYTAITRAKRKLVII